MEREKGGIRAVKRGVSGEKEMLIETELEVDR